MNFWRFWGRAGNVWTGPFRVMASEKWIVEFFKENIQILHNSGEGSVEEKREKSPFVIYRCSQILEFPEFLGFIWWFLDLSKFFGFLEFLDLIQRIDLELIQKHEELIETSQRQQFYFSISNDAFNLNFLHKTNRSIIKLNK